MKNNTKIRLRLSKQLFESLSKQVLAEAKKMDMSGGAYTEAVKAPKASTTSSAPKAPKSAKKEGMEWHDMKGAEDDWKKMSKGDVDDAPSDEDKEDAKPIAEANNPEVDKIVKTLVNKLTKHFGHNDPKATIGALKAALDRLEKKKPEGGEDEGEGLEESTIKEYEHHYERINGTCYRINDEGDRQRVADHYCR